MAAHGRSEGTASRAVQSTVTGEVMPPAQAGSSLPSPRRRISLRNIDAIRCEMGRVYREARRGLIDTSEAGKLTYMLGELRKTYEVSILERRIAALESHP